VVDDYTRLPAAAHQAEVLAPSGGHVAQIDCEAVGLAAVALGAGRERVDSQIDPSVGFTLHKKVGDPVAAGEPLARIHYNDPGRLEDIRGRLERAYRIGPEAPPPRPLIVERLAER
jgi:pyrimidine-nucleoside phosphorylase